MAKDMISPSSVKAPVVIGLPTGLLLFIKVMVAAVTWSPIAGKSLRSIRCSSVAVSKARSIKGVAPVEVQPLVTMPSATSYIVAGLLAGEGVTCEYRASLKPLATTRSNVRVSVAALLSVTVTVTVVVRTSLGIGEPVNCPVFASMLSQESLPLTLYIKVSPTSTSLAVGVKSYIPPAIVTVCGVPLMVGASLTLVTVILKAA